MRSLHGTAARLFGLALVVALPLCLVFAGCTFDTPGAGAPSIGDEAGLLDTGFVPVDAKADAHDAAISVQDASIADAAADAVADTSVPDTSVVDAKADGAGHDSGSDDSGKGGGGPHDASGAG